MSSNHNQIPRVITVDKNPAYPPSIDELKTENKLSKRIEIRQVKYLNNIIVQDHRSIKRTGFWCKKSGFVKKSDKHSQFES